MAVKVLILEDNPVARSFLCRVVRESFSDSISITEAGDLETARRQIGIAGGSSGGRTTESIETAFHWGDGKMALLAAASVGEIP